MDKDRDPLENPNLSGQHEVPAAHFPPPSYQASYGGAAEEPGVNQLPTYEEATEAPPSYQSIFGDIREARHNSSSGVDFLKKLFVLLAGTVGCTVFLGLTMAIPIAMIVIGSKYKDDCRVQPKIPIYLIVGGVVGLVKNFISLCCKAAHEHEQEEQGRRSKKRSVLESLLDCFLTAWFVVGNIWIYGNYKPEFEDTNSDKYCGKTLYLFAFWITTATYIILGTICLCVCCIALLVGSPRQNQPTSHP